MREKQDTLQNERPKRQEKFVAEHFKAFLSLQGEPDMDLKFMTD
jgi:hypothetical protein